MLPNPIFLNVHMYGVMIGLGLLLCFLVLFKFFKQKGIQQEFTDFVFYNGVVSIAVGFGAAAVFQALYNYIENPEAGFHFTGGITFIGGLIGGAACFLIIYFIFRKKYTSRLIDVLSIIPSCILIAHGFGRIGCFFAGCCHGIETDSFLGVQFPELENPVYPTQLYEALFLFVMFAICSYLVIKKDYKHNLSLYLITYGIFRFLIEFIRGDERGEFLKIMSPSQFWSVLMVILGVALFFILEKQFQARQLVIEGAEVSEVAEKSKKAINATKAEKLEASTQEVKVEEVESKKEKTKQETPKEEKLENKQVENKKSKK